MQQTQILFRQILVMFLYMGAGFFLYRKKLVTKEGSAGIANLLIYLILPCVILQSFLTERTPERAAELVWSFLLGTAALLLSVGIAALLYRKKPIDNFASAFSNAGFMGIPLITAMLGGDAVFYVAGFTAMLNILQWFYGQSVLSGQKSPFSLVRVLKSPLVLSLLLGLLLFFLDLGLPDILAGCVKSVSAMNAPVAMVVLGVYLAQADWKGMLTRKPVYLVSLVRLILIPGCTVAFLWLLPGNATMKTALLVAAAAPVGANVAVYAQKLQKDYVYAVETVCLSTLFSIITMPMVLLLSEAFW